LHLRPVDLDLVEQPEIDDVHAELRVLDLAQRLEHVFLRGHAASLAARMRSRSSADGRLDAAASWNAVLVLAPRGRQRATGPLQATGATLRRAGAREPRPSTSSLVWPSTR